MPVEEDLEGIVDSPIKLRFSPTTDNERVGGERCEPTLCFMVCLDKTICLDSCNVLTSFISFLNLLP